MQMAVGFASAVAGYDKLDDENARIYEVAKPLPIELFGLHGPPTPFLICSAPT
jgi:hypothetical protein